MILYLVHGLSVFSLPTPRPREGQDNNNAATATVYYDIICTILQAGGQNMILAWAPSHESSSKNPGF